jgi:hypothetical protein
MPYLLISLEKRAIQLRQSKSLHGRCVLLTSDFLGFRNALHQTYKATAGYLIRRAILLQL